MVLGLIRLIRLLLGEKHPTAEELERKRDELERILREEPERFRRMVEEYSTRLLIKLVRSSDGKLYFNPSYTPMVAWDIVEDIIETAVRMGILRKVKGIQGEYIDVNPAFLEKLGKYDTYNLWGLWLAKELGLPKEVWLDVAKKLNPNFRVYGTTPAEIDGIKRYIRGDRDGALRIWRNAGVREDVIEEYDDYLGLFMENLERIKKKAREIIEQKERQLAGAPKWFSDYLVGQKIAELEKMDRVHPDLFEVNVIIPLKTAYRAFDWMHKKLIQKGTLDLAEVEGYLRKLERKEGYDPHTVQSIREEARTWIQHLGEGRITYRDLANKIKNVKVTTEALMEKFAPLHMEKKRKNEPFTREEIRLVKEHVRRAAVPLKFV